MANNYALSRASIAIPFLDLLDYQNTEPNLALSPFDLDYKQLNTCEIYLPSYLMGGILDTTANLTGSNLIGVQAAESTNNAALHPTLIKRMGMHNSVVNFLVDLAQHSKLQGSHINLTMSYVDGTLRVMHASALSSSQRGFVHSHVYTTFRLIKLIQNFLGQDWKPDYISLAPRLKDTTALAKYTKLGRVLSGM